MEKVNWVPLKQTLDGMALKLAIILVIPILVFLIVKYTLAQIIMLPDTISNFFSAISFLLVFYLMIIWVLG